jgi:hypothetical protein
MTDTIDLLVANGDKALKVVIEATVTEFVKRLEEAAIESKDKGLISADEATIFLKVLGGLIKEED